MSKLSEIVAAEIRRLGDGGQVHAAIEDGVVTLTGEVADEHRRRRIEQRLLQLEGVADVRNRLRLPPPPGGLGAQLAGLLEREGVQIPELEVEDHDGALALYGRANGWFDRDAAERLAWSLPGVRYVDNRIVLPEGAVRPGDGSGGMPV